MERQREGKAKATSGTASWATRFSAIPCRSITSRTFRRPSADRTAALVMSSAASPRPPAEPACAAAAAAAGRAGSASAAVSSVIIALGIRPGWVSALLLEKGIPPGPEDDRFDWRAGPRGAEPLGDVLVQPVGDHLREDPRAGWVSAMLLQSVTPPGRGSVG